MLRIARHRSAESSLEHEGSIRVGHSVDTRRIGLIAENVRAMVDREVELSVRAESSPTRQLAFASGPLRAGPELGSEPDALIPISVGEVELAVKGAWIENAWRDDSESSLSFLFRGGVLVELDLAQEPA